MGGSAQCSAKLPLYSTGCPQRTVRHVLPHGMFDKLSFDKHQGFAHTEAQQGLTEPCFDRLAPTAQRLRVFRKGLGVLHKERLWIVVVEAEFILNGFNCSFKQRSDTQVHLTFANGCTRSPLLSLFPVALLVADLAIRQRIRPRICSKGCLKVGFSVLHARKSNLLASLKVCLRQALENLSSGSHEITVRLNTHPYNLLMYRGQPIQATAIVEVPEPAGSTHGY